MSNTKNIISVLKDNVAEYSGYIITDRVLPNVEDGLKPSQLRILWTMYKDNAVKFTKCGNVTGNVFKYHPHGNTYPTLVNMTQKDRHQVPLIIGKGNFGQHTSKDLQFAAERYTECKLSELALETLEGIRGNMVEYVDNYDGTLKIPKYLPSKFPMVLAFASNGIALGMSSSIPSFNITELCNATKKYLETGEKTLLYPDFITGGYIVKNDDIKKINEKGYGSIKIRGKVEVEEDYILIKEIPYTTTREQIIEKIDSLIDCGKLSEIQYVKDLTDLKKGLLIEIKCKTKTDKKMLVEKLYRMTPLESTFSANMNVLVGGVPKLLGVYEIIDKWYEFRVNCIKKNILHNINTLKKELHLLKGLKNILDNTDLAIEIIRKTGEDNLIKKLCNVFDIDEVQAEYVCNIKLKNINKDYIIKQLSNINDKKRLYNNYKKAYDNNSILRKQVLKGIESIYKKFEVNRKSEIIETKEIIQINKTEEREDYNVKIIFTKDKYFKKVKCSAFKGNNKLKEGDVVEYEIDAKNTDEIVFLCEDLNAYKYKLYEFEDMKLNNLGLYMPNELNTVPYGVFVINKNKGYILKIYEKRIAKIDIESYFTKNNRRKLKNSVFNERLVKAFFLEENCVIEYETTNGNKKEVHTKDLIVKSTRDTRGKTLEIKNHIINVRIKK